MKEKMKKNVMEATFIVVVKIEGSSVQTTFSMCDGAENVDAKVVDLTMLAAELMHENIKGGLAPSDSILTIKTPFGS